MRHAAREQGGFSLLEVLVVLAILGLVLGLSMPMWGGLLEKARPDEAAALIEEGVHEARLAARATGKPAGLYARGDRLEVVPVEAAAEDEPDRTPPSSGQDEVSAIWSALAGFSIVGDEPELGPAVSEASDAAFFADPTFATPAGPAAASSEAVRLAVVAPDGTVWPGTGVELEMGEARLRLAIDAWTGRATLTPVADGVMSGVDEDESEPDLLPGMETEEEDAGPEPVGRGASE